MLVMMKRNVTPLCDRHHKPMQLAQFGERNIGLSFIGHRCTEDCCSRVYQHGQGYIDVTDSISFEKVERRQCPEDLATLYLSEVDENGTQIWRCGQVHCEYLEKSNPNERFHVMVNPIEAGSGSTPGDQPYAQFEATRIAIGERWSGPCLPWPLMLTALSVFGQNTAQLAGIRNSLLNGMSAQLVGVAAPLGVREQELRKAGLKRTIAIANASPTLGPIFV